MNDDQVLIEAKKLLNVEIESLNLIKNNLNSDFPEIVRLLASNNKLIVSGVGKSGLIGRKIAATFASIGKPSFFMHPVDAMHGDLGMIEKGDVVILLSKSGSTQEIIEMMPYVKGRGALTIAITGNTDSFLAHNADYTINAYVEQEGCPLNTAPMSSALVALAIGDALATCVMILNDITIQDFSKQHPLGQIGRNITLEVKEVMHTYEQLPLVNETSSFREAIIETTNKSLGCVCIVNANNELKGIITDGDVRRVLQKIDDIRGVLASEVMTTNPITATPDMLLGDALGLMENRKSQISVLPVVDTNNKVIGVIRIHDIVKSGI
jgi:arabinose-5-phosphate isomerase